MLALCRRQTRQQHGFDVGIAGGLLVLILDVADRDALAQLKAQPALEAESLRACVVAQYEIGAAAKWQQATG